MKKIIIAIIVIIIIAAGYMFVRGRSTNAGQTYTNDTYGYAITIANGLTYRGSEDASGNFFAYDPTNANNALTINISTPSGDETSSGATVELNGQSAKISTFTDEKGLNRKSYQILHNGMIYEITFAPLDDPRFEAMAQSFRFT